MRLVTWNVNSLNARYERVEAWLAEVEPDIVCMQETKLANDTFPALGFQAMGYESAHHGQGRWNGVAILSRVGLDDVTVDFADGGEPDVDARIVSATCGGIRVASVYVPNGRALDHEHYRYKLAWLGRVRRHLEATTTADADVVVAGDFNIAPTDADVYDVTRFDGETHVSAAEREALDDIKAWGLRDVFRDHVTADGVFSWWDYRRGDFHQGRGMRIDLVLATESLAQRVDWVLIDRNARKGKSPSDHAPVIVDFS